MQGLLILVLVDILIQWCIFLHIFADIQTLTNYTLIECRAFRGTKGLLPQLGARFEREKHKNGDNDIDRIKKKVTVKFNLLFENAQNKILAGEILAAQFSNNNVLFNLLTHSFGIDKPLIIIQFASYLCGGAGISETPLSNLCACTTAQNKVSTYSITMDKTITAFGNNSHNNINTCKQNNIFKIKSTVCRFCTIRYIGAQSW